MEKDTEKQVSIWIDSDGNVCLAVPGEGGETAVFLTPQEAVLIGNDLVELGNSKLREEADEEIYPWMRIPMQFLLMEVKPLGDDSGERAYISCWIRDQSPENAALLAGAHAGEFGWQLERIVRQDRVNRETYANDEENLHYFDQALIDEIVLVFDDAPDDDEEAPQ